MYILREHSLAFLAHPRAASTAVATALTRIGGVRIGTHHGGFGEALLRPQDWRTVVVVRNHWDAVVSWYHLRDWRVSFASFVHQFLVPWN